MADDLYGPALMPHFIFLISLFLLFALGFLTVISLLPNARPGEGLAMSLPFGMGLTTLLLWGLLSLKLPASRGTLIFLQALLAGGLLYYTRRKVCLRNVLPCLSPGRIKPGVGWVIILLLFAVGLVFNIFFPLMAADGVGYDMIGKLMVGEQGIRIHQAWFASPGQNRTLGFHLISGFFYLFGSNSPKIVQSLYYLSLVGLFYIAIQRFVSCRMAKGFTLLLATSPMVWWHSFLWLNNLSSGFYFFCGTLYWFYFLHFKDGRYLPIASLAFMLAAWMRYENLVLFIAPLLFVCFTSVNTGNFKAVAKLLIFPALFAVLWALFSITYFSNISFTVYYLYLALVLISLNILLFLAHANKVEIGLTWKAGGAIMACCAIFVLTNKPLLEGIWKILSRAETKFLVHVLNKVSWGAGIVLAIFIPFYYSSFTSSQKYLLFNLLLLLMGITLILSFLGPTPLMGTSLSYKLEWFFQTMSLRISRSSNRMAFILMPSVFFLLGISFSSTNISAKSVQYLNRILWNRSLFNGLNFLILVNITVIFYSFILPRSAFLYKHWGEPIERILQSPGPRDNPYIHQSRLTNAVAYSIKKLTAENAIILMPNPDSLIGISEALEALYPRRVYWGGRGSVVQDQIYNPDRPAYLVTHPGWMHNKCKKQSQAKPLAYHDWFLCPAT